MLDHSLIVFQQIFIMMLLMVMGYILCRKGTLDEPMTGKLSTLLNTYAGPCCLIEAFQRDFDPAMAGTLAISFLAAALILAMSMGIAGVAFPRHLPDRRVSIVLTNNGFMAIPLLTAMFGPVGVFLGSGHMVAMAIVQWTYVVCQLDRSYGISVKKILLTPGVLASAFGLILFVSPVKLPAPVFSAVGLLADLNTPLAMLILGAYLARIDLRELVRNREVWKTAALRMLLIPALTVGLLLVLPVSDMAKLVLMVAVAAPTGISAAMFSEMFGGDYLFSTRVVGLTTILSLLLLPGWIAVLSMLL